MTLAIISFASKYFNKLSKHSNYKNECIETEYLKMCKKDRFEKCKE